MQVLIVGAGMTGLAAATRLTELGHRPRVVDKGRAVGGRMASKRFAGARFDHGAQHFGARAPGFQAEVDAWVAAGIASEWYRAEPESPEDSGERRWAGVPAMRSICEHLATGLDVVTGVEVTRVVDTGDGVAIEGEARRYDAALVTAPVPQTLRMLADWSIPSDQRDLLTSIVYEPCLAGMAVLDAPADLDLGHRSAPSESIAWIADNQQKGVSEIPAITIHATPEFSRQHLEETPEDWLPLLLDEATTLLGAGVVDAIGHRWRFAMPLETESDGALLVGRHPMVAVGGDAFAGARVEGAWTSGITAAELLHTAAGGS
jgi:renalase